MTQNVGKWISDAGYHIMVTERMPSRTGRMLGVQNASSGGSLATSCACDSCTMGTNAVPTAIAMSECFDGCDGQKMHHVQIVDVDVLLAARTITEVRTKIYRSYRLQKCTILFLLFDGRHRLKGERR